VFKIGIKDGDKKDIIEGKSLDEMKRLFTKIKRQCKGVSRWPRLNETSAKSKNTERAKKAVEQYMQELMKISQVVKCTALKDFRENKGSSSRRNSATNIKPPLKKAGTLPPSNRRSRRTSSISSPSHQRKRSSGGRSDKSDDEKSIIEEKFTVDHEGVIRAKDDEISQLKKNLEEVTEEAKQKALKIEELSKKQEDLEKQLQIAKAAAADDVKVQEMNASTSGAEASIKVLEEKWQESETRNKELLTKCETLQSKLAASESKNTELSKEFEIQMQKVRADAEANIKALSGGESEAAKQIEELSADAERQRAEITQIKEENRSLSERLTAVEADCVEKTKNLDESKKDLDEREERVKHLQKELAAKEQDADQLKSDLGAKDTKVEALSKEVTAKNEDVELLKKDLASSQDLLKTLEEKLKSATTEKEVKEGEMLKKISDLETQIGEMKTEAEASSVAQQGKAEDAEKELGNLKTEKESLTKELNDVKTLNDKLNKDILDMKDSMATESKEAEAQKEEQSKTITALQTEVTDLKASMESDSKEAETEREKLKKTIVALETERTNVKAELDKRTSEFADLTKQERDAQVQIKGLQESQEQEQKERTALSEKLAATEKEKCALEEKVKSQEEKVAELEAKIQEQKVSFLKRTYTMKDLKNSAGEKENLMNEIRQENEKLQEKLQMMANVQKLNTELNSQLETQEQEAHRYSEKVEETRKRFKQEQADLMEELANLNSVLMKDSNAREDLEGEIRKLRRELKHAQEDAILHEEIAEKRKSVLLVKKPDESDDVDRLKLKITQLEAEKSTLKTLVDKMPESTKDAHLKTLEREQEISRRDEQIAQLQVEIKRLQEQNKIQVESLKRKSKQRQSMLEDQLNKYIKPADLNSQSLDDRQSLEDQLALNQESRENERLKFRTKINELVTKVESLTLQLSQGKNAHRREITAIKAHLSKGDLQELERRAGQTQSTSQEREPADDLKLKIEMLHIQLSEAKENMAHANKCLKEATNSKVHFVNKTALEIERLRNIIRQLSGATTVNLPSEEDKVQSPMSVGSRSAHMEVMHPPRRSDELRQLQERQSDVSAPPAYPTFAAGLYYKADHRSSIVGIPTGELRPFESKMAPENTDGFSLMNEDNYLGEMTEEAFDFTEFSKGSGDMADLDEL